MTPLQSLIASGTKVWLDSVDPQALAQNREWGITGATSNPIIISDLIKTGHFDKDIDRLMRKGHSDEDLAWQLTDMLVRQAQESFAPVWEKTRGDDGYVSFELDPLIEDPNLNLPLQERTRRYIELGKRWSDGHRNRRTSPLGRSGPEVGERAVGARGSAADVRPAGRADPKGRASRDFGCARRRGRRSSG